jgi:Tol biopolymer transport system component
MKMAPFSVVLSVVWLLLSPLEVVAQEGQRLKQLTDDSYQDGFPSWSPDGRQIVFSRNGGDTAPQKTGLWLVSPEGGEPIQLTTVPGEHPDWSPDGHYIVFDGDYGNSIQLVSASGGTPIRIVPASIPVQRGGQPKWSPDGSRIAFKEGANLWVLDISTGRLDKIFSEEGKLPIPVCWSLDSREIYIYLREATSHNSAICAVSVRERTKRTLTPEKEALYRYADLSPDGSLLAVVWCQERLCNLWAMSCAGGSRVQITSSSGYDDGPCWSPDAKRIAFVSTRSGSFDIWTIDVDVEQLALELMRQPE